MKVKNVIILGAVPPPIGGVTVHTLRLISGLKSLGYKYEFVNLRPITEKDKFNIKKYISNVLRILKSRDIDVIHYQLNNLFELALFVMISIIIRSRIITTVHSFRPELFSKIKKTIFNLIKRTRTEFIAPSKTTKEALVAKGVKYENIRVLNTFLPPSESEINAKISNEIMDFIDKRSKIIVANAFKLYRDDLGVDVYGLDMCIEACKAIPDTNFIFCVPLIGDQNYYNECVKKIEKYNIGDRFLIVNKNISLVSLLKYADLFVRPTSTDSFGVSVAEALAMGVPAIASDVCERTEGAILFKSRNIADFILKIKFSLKSKERGALNIINRNYLKKYMKLYT